MYNDYIISQLKTAFLGKESFSRTELYSFFQLFDPDLKDTTFRSKIHDLKNKCVITPLSKSFFTLVYKPPFQPKIGETECKLFSKIKKQFPTLQFCIWSSQIVSEFMLHIPAKFITVLQIEKEAIEPVCDYLKTQKYRNIFIQPDAKEIDRYVYDNDAAIVLQSLVTNAPIQIISAVATVTLEKLIVDLLSDKKLFVAFQGQELVHIVNTAYNRYLVDFTKLFRYAKRRRKEIELTEFLLKTDIPKTLFI
jgi:hypothetical protein